MDQKTIDKKLMTNAAKLLIFSITVFLICLISTVLKAQPVQLFSPIADASVYVGNSTANYGAADLLVKQRPTGGITRYAYLKFDLSAFNLNHMGKATLRLYCRDKQNDANPAIIDAYAVADNSWQENTLNWSNKPAFGAKIAATQINSKGAYYEWDITNYVKLFDPSSSPVLSLVLSDQLASENTITFNAKENGINSPQLVIDEVNDFYSQTYYVDSDTGNDSNDGLTEATAWQTLEKVNSVTFGGGAKILLKSGSVWSGQLKPKGSGTPFSPIIVDKYGDGPKPLVNGNGVIAQGVVLLSNQSYWEINNLEITNNASENAERRGVEVNASNYGTVEHIYLRNLVIHDIKGTIGNADDDKKSAGIYFTVINDNTVDTRFNDILVEGCQIYNCQNEGIVTNNNVKVSDYPGTPEWERRKYTNLVVRNNTIHHISKNAMIIRLADGGLVERNLCYETATGTQGNTIFSRSSRGTVFQYNEGFLNRSAGADGSLYDPDINSPGTIWQYSYSHDNAHGLVWFCTDEQDDNIVVRYNISQNDKGNLVYFNFPLAEAKVYNNVFYIGAGLSPTIIKENQNNSHTYTYANNIVYNYGGSPLYNFVDNTASKTQTRSISKNIFYNTPSSSKISTSTNSSQDPMFVSPGTGSNGLNTVNGYKLKPGSPALKAGTLIANNGGQDYFGLAVSKTTAPNIGFYNGNGITVTAPDPNFHIYNLIGQSNMAGRGVITSEYANISHPRVLMLNKENQWVIAKHPLHFDNMAAGVGLGLSFAIKMAEANPDITIGLIPSAVGGTGISAWTEGALDESSDTHPYDDALYRARYAMQFGVIKGTLWHQGESNRTNSYTTWPDKVKQLIAKLRKEFNDPMMPFIIGEIGHFVKSTSGTNNADNINSLLPQLVADMSYTAMVSATGLTDKGDDLHFNSPSLVVFGERYAEQMLLVQEQLLPIKLSDFRVSKNINSTELKWATLNEINNDYFEPERSADGKIFSSLGKVKGSGTSLQLQTYSFLDKEPLHGYNYYRIKQTDFNGTSSYSHAVAFNFGFPEQLLTVFPNPVLSEFIIKHSFPEGSLIALNIYTTGGNLVAKNFAIAGKQLVQDVSKLAAGLYILELRSTNNSYKPTRAKFIKK